MLPIGTISPLNITYPPILFHLQAERNLYTEINHGLLHDIDAPTTSILSKLPERLEKCLVPNIQNVASWIVFFVSLHFINQHYSKYPQGFDDKNHCFRSMRRLQDTISRERHSDSSKTKIVPPSWLTRVHEITSVIYTCTTKIIWMAAAFSGKAETG